MTFEDFKIGDEVMITTDKYDHFNKFKAKGMEGTVEGFINGRLVHVRTPHGLIPYDPGDLEFRGNPW